MCVCVGEEIRSDEGKGRTVGRSLSVFVQVWFEGEGRRGWV